MRTRCDEIRTNRKSAAIDAHCHRERRHVPAMQLAPLATMCRKIQHKVELWAYSDELECLTSPAVAANIITVTGFVS